MSEYVARQAPTKIRRRNRMITSCLECRRRKLKCDKAHPCVNCKKASRDCVFLAPALDSASQLRLAEVKEKMGMLEVSLEQEIARTSYDESGGTGVASNAVNAEDEDTLEPTPLAMADVVFDDDDPDNDFYDLGFRIGKLRLSDRVGGFFRPTMVQELGALLRELKHEDTASLGVIFQRPANFIGPDEDFIAPSSDFMLSSGRSGMSLIHFLPARSVADRLLQQYWYSVHPVCRLMHRPTFEAHYRSFWEDISMGVEPLPSLQALVFAMLFSAAVSADKDTCMDSFGTSKLDLIKNLQQATEIALGRAKFLRSTRLQTLQAFVMYLTPMCREQISRAHCALVASAIRLAENMSLHRDGARYGLKAVETHVRRLVWWQLLWLDLRCCEARGPRLIVREDDFDTKMPVNKNDENLKDTGSAAVPGVVDRWTDMVPMLLKLECLEVARSIWFDRVKIDKKEKTLTEVMIGIESARRRIYAKYTPLLEEGTPIQQLTKTICELNLSKWHTAVLHRFHRSVVREMPQRLRKIMIGTARAQLEFGVTLNTAPALKPWKWYASAVHAWHTAFLLLVDFYTFNDWEQPERTWRCMDWVFDSPPTPMPLVTKARLMVLETWDRMRIYREDRKIRPPTDAFKDIKLTGGPSSVSSRELAALAGEPSIGDGLVKIEHLGDDESNHPQPVVAASGGNYLNSSSSSTTTTTTTTAVGTTTTAAAAPQGPQSFMGMSDAIPSEATDAAAFAVRGVDFGSTPSMTSPGSSAPELEMPDIDWNEWDKLFPPMSYDPIDNIAAYNFGYNTDQPVI